MKTLAIILFVLSPIDVPRSFVPQRVDEESWAALKQVAWHLELSGPLCMWIEDFRSELFWVRTRHQELRESPRIAEGMRLPPHQACIDLLKFADARHQFLEMAQGERLYVDLSEDLREAKFCARFWREACLSQSPVGFWSVRRASMQRLREMIGEDSWMAGAWPSPVTAVNLH